MEDQLSWRHRAASDERQAIWRQVRLFLILTFVVTWGIGAFALIGPLELGEQGISGIAATVLFFIAVYAPSVVALCLILRERGFFAGLRHIGDGIIAPRSVPRLLLWTAIGILIIPASWLLVDTLAKVGGGGHSVGKVDLYGLFVTTPLLLLTTAYIFFDPGPIGEELGWRGYLLPKLLRLMDPIRASVLIGIIWGVWHLPAFFVQGTGQSTNVFVFMLGNWIGWSLISTWIYIRMNGNWFVPGVISHAYVNAALTPQGGAAIDPVYALGTLLVASLIILFEGGKLGLQRAR